MKVAVPSAWSSSSAAWSVTVLLVFQFEVVKVSEPPDFTDRFVSWSLPDLRATVTVTFPEGFVASFTW